MGSACRRWITSGSDVYHLSGFSGLREWCDRGARRPVHASRDSSRAQHREECGQAVEAGQAALLPHGAWLFDGVGCSPGRLLALEPARRSAAQVRLYLVSHVESSRRSLVATCEARPINPFEYLADVLTSSRSCRITQQTRSIRYCQVPGPPHAKSSSAMS